MKKTLYIFSVCLLLLGSASCTKMLQEKSHVDVDKENFLNNASEAKIVLDGVYRNLVEQGLYAYDLSMLFTITTDLAQCEGNSATNFREIPTNAFNKSNKQVEDTWRQLYFAINTANDFLEAIDAKKGNYSLNDKKLAEQYIGEAKALRALFYFELVRWYGNVSLILSTKEADKEPEEFTQATPEALYAQIEQDLKDAIEVLPWANEGGSEYRMSKGSVMGLLTKVYATWAGYPVKDQSKWADAVRVGGELISSARHSLNPDFQQVWINTCNGRWDGNESLIEVSFYAPTVTGTSSQDPVGRIGKWNGVKATKEDVSGGQPGNVKVVYTFTEQWQKQNDPRFNISIADYAYVLDVASQKVVKQPYTFKESAIKQWQLFTPRKWDTGLVEKSNQLANADNSNINWYILRYSDVLLLYAEAINEAEAGPSQAAYDAINMVRRRGFGVGVNTAGATRPVPTFNPDGTQIFEPDGVTPVLVDAPIDLAGLSQDDFRQAVRQERAYELCFEGHRRLDLVRWGTYYQTIQNTANALKNRWATANYPAMQYTVEGKHELFPIPQRDMDLMGQFKQNPKW